MKKRILGLALALIMVISLLPMTTFAADTPMAKVTVNDDLGNVSDFVGGSKATWYVAFVDVLDADNKVIGTKPVKATAQPTDNYIALSYDDANAILDITFNNVNYMRTAYKSGFLTVTNNSNYTKAFDVRVTLNGDNYITGTNHSTNAKMYVKFENSKTVTFTGSGSLNINSYQTSGDMISAENATEFKVSNTTLRLYNDSGFYRAPSSTIYGINVKGNIVIEGGNVSIRTHKGPGLKASSTSSITIQKGSEVYLEGGSTAVVEPISGLSIDNSSVKITKAAGNETSIFTKLPAITGKYSTKTLKINKTTSTIEELGLQTGSDIAKKTFELNLVHDHGRTDCTQAYTCPDCGKQFAANEHVFVAEDFNCTTAVKCAVAGCTAEAITAYADHVAAEDDFDCTSSTMCANGFFCDNRFVEYIKEHKSEAFEAKPASCTEVGWDAGTGCTRTGCYVNKTIIPATGHTPDADDGDCTTPILCVTCQAEVNAGAASHTGGTATCTKKAVCDVCQKEYGELAPHEPKEGTYLCSEDHPCANCTGNYREAGTHVGGGTEATCQKKAVCKCGEEYGELGACKPEADDGDCTTPVKCSVCGKETKAAEKAHKYTDKADTTCDNADCKNTRKVEGTENPKTGDNTALVLMVSLMATAAAAFVCTKKFAR